MYFPFYPISIGKTHTQTQRFTVEYQKVFEKSIERVSIWRRFAGHFAVVDQRMEPYRFEALERGNGVSSSEYFFNVK